MAAFAIVGTTAVLVLGAFVVSLPVVGAAGSFLLTAQTAVFVLAGVGGAGLAALSAVLGARRSGLVVGAVGLAATVGAAAILTSHVETAERHGADVDLIASLLPRTFVTGPRRDRTVDYTTWRNQQLRIDLYLPPGRRRAARFPVVVYVHGGGWVDGDRTTQAEKLRWFADHGYVAVGIDYSKATPSRPTWDLAGPQVACALSFISNHVRSVGGDPDRLFAFGDSSGGALALTTTYAAASGVAQSSCGGEVPPVRAVAATVPAVDPVALYESDDPLFGKSMKEIVRQYLGGPPSRFPDRARAVTSATYISTKAPPTLIFLAGDDRVVPRDGTEAFVDQARAAGVPAEVVSFRWADHAMGSRNHSVINQATLQLMHQFFDRHGA